MNDFDEFVAGSVEPLLRTAYLITWDGGDAGADRAALPERSPLQLRLWLERRAGRRRRRYIVYERHRLV